MEVFAFFSGIAYAYSLSIYPLLLLAFILLFDNRLRYIAISILGLTLALFHEFYIRPSHMPSEGVVQHAVVVGVITSIPKVSHDNTQFLFELQELNHQKAHAIIRMNCFNTCPKLKALETWQLVANLKVIKNFANPGSYDFETAMRAKHIYWQGTTVSANALRLVKAKKTTWLGLRSQLAKNIEQVEHIEPVIGMIEAITLGVSNHLSAVEWDLFRRTGTTHLMVIAGTHVGFIAGLSYRFFQWAWCRMGKMALFVAAPRVGAILALGVSLFYVLIAGVEIPAQRSWLAGFVVFIKFFSDRRFTGWQGWRLGLWCVLLLEPHAVLHAGFYLSFFAIVILLIVNKRYKAEGFRQGVYLQMGCLIGLMPMTLFWFSYGAINGFIANILAIPLVAFVIVPLGIITVLLLAIFPSPMIVYPLESCCRLLYGYLSFVNRFDGLNLTFSFYTFFWPLLLMIAIGVWVLLPYWYYRCLAFVIGFCVLNQSYPKIHVCDWQLDVLDVGQGLASVISTAHHHLVFDTGLAFYQGSDMGERVILPYLNSIGVKSLDAVVISHPDLDHRGGLPSLQKALPIRQLMVNLPSFYHQGISCHKVKPWIWDGVKFEFLPIKFQFSDKNNMSCVLKVSSRAGSVLLPGDVEKPAEGYLVNHYGDTLKASVLVPAHHGSKTSSTRAFINAVSPDYAVLSYGFANRYHFPHAATLKTLSDYHVTEINTRDCGMTTFVFSHDDLKPAVTCFRYYEHNLLDFIVNIMHNHRTELMRG